MTNNKVFFIIFRLSQIATIFIMIRWNTSTALLIVLIGGLIYSVLQNKNELKLIKPFGGFANWITLLRGLLLFFLLKTAPVLSPYKIGLIGLIISIGDFMDGYIARTLNQITKLGGYLDEEMDAMYFILIGFILFQMNLCGAYILLPGIAKYFKDVLLTIFPNWFLKPIRMPSAKWIAGISFILYLTPFLLPPQCYSYFTIGSVLALSISLLAEIIIRFSGFSKNKTIIRK